MSVPHDSVSGAVRCPYYKSHTRLSVVCQWVGGSVLTQRFPSSQRRVKHVYKYCAAMEFGRCPLAAVMNCVYAKWLRPRARDAVPGPCPRDTSLGNPSIGGDDRGVPADGGDGKGERMTPEEGIGHEVAGRS